MKCEVPESSVYTATWMKRHAAANGSSTECGEAVQLKWKKISQSLSVTDTTWQEVLCVLAAWLQVNSPQSFLAPQLTVCLEKRSRLVSHITTLAASRLVIQSDRLSHLWGLHQEELCLICSKMTDRRSKKKTTEFCWLHFRRLPAQLPEWTTEYCYFLFICFVLTTCFI